MQCSLSAIITGINVRTAGNQNIYDIRVRQMQRSSPLHVPCMNISPESQQRQNRIIIKTKLNSLMQGSSPLAIPNMNIHSFSDQLFFIKKILFVLLFTRDIFPIFILTTHRFILILFTIKNQLPFGNQIKHTDNG